MLALTIIIIGLLLQCWKPERMWHSYGLLAVLLMVYTGLELFLNFLCTLGLVIYTALAERNYSLIGQCIVRDDNKCCIWFASRHRPRTGSNNCCVYSVHLKSNTVEKLGLRYNAPGQCNKYHECSNTGYSILAFLIVAVSVSALCVLFIIRLVNLCQIMA